MGQALYRKYRSKSLEEVIGQEHITKTLARALANNRISHAYLFTGPRGVGKTSIARILAYAVNGLAYDEKGSHLDIIEIDAASNRRIDEIRELRERVNSAPSQAKYKVYIIDEVHMLTKEAFNALLKTLEEPPAHAIFILATTESHKVPETIVSRTQRFAFRPISEAAIVNHLKEIAKKEKIIISDDALELLATHGGGSFRDSISLLDQVGSRGNKVEISDVEALLGLAAEDEIASLLKAIELQNAREAVKLLDTLLAKSTPSQVAKQLGESLQQILISNHTAQVFVAPLLRELIEVSASHDPTAALHLAIIAACLLPAPGNTPPSTHKVQDSPSPAVSQDDEPSHEVTKQEEPANVDVEDTSSVLPQTLWMKCLAEIKKHHATLYGIARMASAEIDDKTLTLICDFPFHQKQLSDSKNLQIITDVMKRLNNGSYEIKVTLKQNESKTKTPNEKRKKGDIETISNIFGGAEVLES